MQSSNANPIHLTRRQMIRMIEGQRPGVIHAIELEQYPGWRYGTFTLHQTQLGNFIQEIERRFDVQIVLQDDSIQRIPVSGLFKAADALTAVEAVCTLTQTSYTPIPGGYRIQ